MNPKQLAEARLAAGPNSLGTTLVGTGAISSKDLIAFIAAELEIPHIDLKSYVVEPAVLHLVPAAIAQKYTLIPLFQIEDTLTIAIADPLNVFALDDLRFRAGMDIKLVLASKKSIETAVKEYYRDVEAIGDAIKDISGGEFDVTQAESASAAQLQQLTNQPPVVRLANEIIQHAVAEGASDMHLEPGRDSVELRYRIDGALYKGASIPKKLQMAAVSRLKIMADMDITERRVPQDGRIQTEVLGKLVDIRVSTFPTTHGEKVVLRILDRESFDVELDTIGMPAEYLGRLRTLLARPYGLIVSCGPTGSGKSTTLYAILKALNTPEKNIVTLEDPVEYDIAGISQGQINPKAGLTFASGLRTILRQDPNIIMVGEVRDFVTAELSARAALTGHMVLTTMHTVDAPSAAVRFMDIGVEPFLVASSLSAIVAQRLVRRICPDCKKQYAPSTELVRKIGLADRTDITFYHGTGCKHCHYTGYKGRAGIFELMVLNEAIREEIMKKATTDTVKKEAAKAGYRPMREDGIAKVIAGITTIEEVLRETSTED